MNNSSVNTSINNTKNKHLTLAMRGGLILLIFILLMSLLLLILIAVIRSPSTNPTNQIKPTVLFSKLSPVSVPVPAPVQIADISPPSTSSVHPVYPPVPPTVSSISSVPTSSMLAKLPSFIAEGKLNGKFQVDKFNHLIITYDVKMIFDQLLNSGDGWNMEEGESILLEYLKKNLPSPASAEASQLLAQYRNYRQETDIIEEKLLQELGLVARSETEITTAEVNSNLLQALFLEVSSLRRKIFDEKTVGVFFNNEEKHAKYNIHIAKILERKDLNEEEKISLIRSSNYLPKHRAHRIISFATKN
ncbi:MAG: hypothetical protein HQK53_16900 [Oligoflexia bacterium]|nr:hypothetical protein [Oligoflexia bacterium]